MDPFIEGIERKPDIYNTMVDERFLKTAIRIRIEYMGLDNNDYVGLLNLNSQEKKLYEEIVKTHPHLSQKQIVQCVNQRLILEGLI